MRRRMLLNQTPPKPQGALYWYGDECVDVTGGDNEIYPILESSYWAVDVRKGYTIKNATSFDMCAGERSTNNIWSIGFATTIMIDLTNYTKLYANIESISLIGTWAYFELVASSAIPFKDTPSITTGKKTRYTSSNFHTGIMEMDISNLTGTYYICFDIQRQSAGEAIATINKIWLE